MQRLLDHFRYCSDVIATTPNSAEVAAERLERPQLHQGRFGGKPRFHDSLDLVDVAGQYNQSYEDYFIIGRDAPHATDSNKVYY